MGAKVFKRARQLARKIGKGQPALTYDARKGTVSTDCVRGIYHQLKKQLRRGYTIGELEASILPQLHLPVPDNAQTA